MITPEEAIEILKKEDCSNHIILHSIEVSKQAIFLGKKYNQNNYNVNLNNIEIGSLLHDIGKSKTYGINHAIVGVSIAKKYNVNNEILNIIKKHIGCGIDNNEAIIYKLPIDDYFPKTDEEKIVAHADNLIDGINKITIEERIDILKKKKLLNKKLEDRYLCLHNEIIKKAGL